MREDVRRLWRSFYSSSVVAGLAFHHHDPGRLMGRVHLATFCKGSTVTNSGVGSSTAQEWGAASACPAPDNTRLCSAPAAFSANAGTSYTHVWLSVGGNDKMGSTGCALTVAQVTSRVAAAINAVKAAAPGAAIVMTGYCALTTAPEGYVRIHENHHLWSKARIGQAQTDGQYKVIYETEDLMEPDPFPEGYQ